MQAGGTALLVAVLYYVGAKVGFALTPQRLPISMLWPPNALLLAALLLTPPRRWWLLIAAVLPAHLVAELQAGVPTAMVLGWYVSNCSEALLGAGATLLLCRRTPRFDSFRDISVLLLCSALLAPLLSSFMDAAFVQLAGWRDTGYWQLVRLRATSNVLAALTVVPLVLTWVHGAREAIRAPARRYAEAGLLLAGLVATSVLVFNWLEPEARDAPALFYAPLPFLLWAAVRFGAMGVSSATALMSGIAIWGVVNGLGLFVGGSPEDNARAVQFFLIAATVPLLLLATLLAERRRVEHETREQRHQLTHLSRVAMLGGLSGAIAHELNQPLTAILANAQAAQHLLAAGRVNPQEIDEILRDITAADRHAAGVIRRLRALLQDGKTQLQLLDANHVVREVLELARADFARRHVGVVTQLEPRLPPIRSDRIQLQQVLLNLAMNACEAMGSGPVSNRVLTVKTRAGENGSVHITFIDRGPGFSESQREKMFEPFYTTKPNGLGLGLSISRSIVGAHGGRLWATSEAGATFHIALPAAAAAEPPSQTLVQ